MKKFLALGALALSVAVLSNQQASAWTNIKFGVGLNLNWQAGGNNFAWGLFRNGQPPCSESCGSVPSPCPCPQGGYGYLQPGSNDQSFVGGLTPPSNAPAPAPAPAAPAQNQSYRTSHTVNYQYFPYTYNYGYAYGYNYGNIR